MGVKVNFVPCACLRLLSPRFCYVCVCGKGENIGVAAYCGMQPIRLMILVKNRYSARKIFLKSYVCISFASLFIGQKSHFENSHRGLRVKSGRTSGCKPNVRLNLQLISEMS